MGSNSGMINWVFQNSATAIGEGNILGVSSGMVTMNIEIKGTGTSTVTFEGKSLSDGDWYPIMGCNLTDLSLVTSTAIKGGLWQISLDALSNFRVRVSDFVSGNISAFGRVVN